MKLKELIDERSMALLQGSNDTEITGITYASNLVKPGMLFVAIPGLKTDGHQYVDDAVARGAAAIAISRRVLIPLSVGAVRVEDSRTALAHFAHLFYGKPSTKLRMVGITGTNGKTTSSFLIKAILRAAGHKSGLVGTIQMEIGDKVMPMKHTTPEAPDLQQALNDMLHSSVTHAVMEVSSHSLALQRVKFVEYDTVVFTNLTQDHLDFHNSMEEYFMTKATLFTHLFVGEKRHKTAVVNIDDPWGQRLASLSPSHCRVLTYGFSEKSDVYATDITSGVKGSTFLLHSPWGTEQVSIRTPGRHSIYNALAAAGATLSEGCSLANVKTGLAEATVSGRMEPVDVGQPFGIYVDYAHSPDSLENVLQSCRSFSEGKVIVVFGCGGDRDKTKRPIMGEIAARLADVAVVTSDNPRSEDPEAIIADVFRGITADSRATVLKEPDRRVAIGKAIALAEKGDVVLIAGKGHENYQVFAHETVHFDDGEEARKVLQELMK